MEDTTNNSGNTTVENNTENVKPTPKKATKAKTKTQRPKSTHPPTSEMVTAAIKELKDRKGSSLQAIKKYIVATYKVDGEKVTPFIKRYLKTAVSSGSVVQTKGKGASGSFKLSTVKGGTTKSKPQRSPKEKKATDKSVEKKNAVANKPASNSKKAKAPKKTETAKKPADQKKPKATSSPKTAAKAGVKTAAAAATAAAVATAEKKTTKKATQAKTISKTRKTAKAPAAKTRTPKPKKATTNKATAKK
ncbi:hypothetical protein HZH68_007247 [Vespula germanica]|uniref:H15 domain-containing protein n=1 Tax=Vespula germanica TaxID=30212 RepID=A0A834K8P4_VESGE|nr:hypothetical protein HZH68_007247 [Vespula germanica]